MMITMTKKCLAERMLGEKMYSGVQDKKLYKAFIDGMTSVTMGLTFGTANDYYVTGMEPRQVLVSRMISIPINLATGSIYGRYRDRVYRFCHTTDKSSWLKRYITDVLAFATFQAPLYVGITTVAGADRNEIIRGTTVLTFASPVVGKVSGYTNDVFRRAGGLKTSGELAAERRLTEHGSSF